MATSTLLRTLQKKGLVERMEHASDSRAKVVTLSEKGTELIKQAVITVEDFDHSFFDLLGTEKTHCNRQLHALLR